MKLTQPMEYCVDAMKEWGGIKRWPGGFWGDPRSTLRPRGEESYGTSTIEALVTRKVAEYTEYVDGRSGRFPVAAKLIEAAASRDKFDPTSEADPDDDSCEHGMSPAYACSECRNQ